MRQIRRHPLSIGVEVGARTLKAAWVSRRAGGGLEWRYAERPRSHDDAPEALRQDLAQLLRPLRRRWFRAQVVLAAPTSYLHRLTVQAADAKRLPEAVREQLPRLLPFDVERAQVQFRLVRHQRVEAGLECLVSLAVCERQPLEHDLEVLWQAGWVPTEVAPSALALLEAARALQAVGNGSLVLMDIGARRTTIVLVEDGEAVYARDVTLGDDHLTDALTGQVVVGQQTLSLSRDEAESLKRQFGIPEPSAETEAPAEPAHSPMPSATYRSMIQPILEQLLSEIRRTMTFGAQPGMVPAPAQVLISGEGSRLPRYDQWLSKHLGVPVHRLSCEPFVGAAGSVAAVTCGLALFQQAPALDLQPPSFRRRGVVVRTAAWLWRGLAVVGLVIWIGAGSWQVQHHALRPLLTTRQARWTALQPVVALQEALASHTQLVHRLMHEQGVSMDWFRQLARRFPNPVRLTRLAVDPKRQVSLEGEAEEREQTPEAYVSALTLWLEQDRLCRDVHLGSTRRLGTDGQLVAFSLRCQLP